MNYLPPVAVLDRDLRHAGIPILSVSGGGTTWTVTYGDTATQAQKDQGDAMAAAFDGKARKSRLLIDIYTDIGALTALQKTAIWNDLNGGTPPKWTQDEGPNAPDLHIVWMLATQLGTVQTVSDKNTCRQMLITIYVIDQPLYLVNPPWATEINIPGDMPVD